MIKEIQESLKAATSGPWRIFEGRVFGKSNTALDPLIHEFDEESKRDKNNAHLIAKSPEYLEWCIGEITQLKKQLNNTLESWNEQKEEIRSLRAGYVSANARQDEELYFWEPYAENHLETLTGGVVIRAEWIRQLIDEGKKEQANELERLREENERLREQTKRVVKINNEYELEIEQLRTDKAALIDALQWYADEVNYLPYTVMELEENVLLDKGNKARTTLKQLTQEP